MDKILDFLLEKVGHHLVFRFGVSNTSIGFHNSSDWDPMNFQSNQISILLINIEEEKQMRPNHLYQRKNDTGKLSEVKPEIRLNLYLLFVAKFSDNKEAWKQLQEVISFFQSKPFFDSANSPDLPNNVYKIILELVSLKFSEQNEIWSMLKAPYHPSVLYRVKALIVQEEQISISSAVTSIQQQIQE